MKTKNPSLTINFFRILLLLVTLFLFSLVIRNSLFAQKQVNVAQDYIADEWVLTKGWFADDNVHLERKDTDKHNEGVYYVYNFMPDGKIKHQIHNPKKHPICGTGLVYLEKAYWETANGGDLIIYLKGGHTGVDQFEHKIRYKVAKLGRTELVLEKKSDLLGAPDVKVKSKPVNVSMQAID